MFFIWRGFICNTCNINWRGVDIDPFRLQYITTVCNQCLQLYTANRQPEFSHILSNPHRELTLKKACRGWNASLLSWFKHYKSGVLTLSPSHLCFSVHCVQYVSVEISYSSRFAVVIWFKANYCSRMQNVLFLCHYSLAKLVMWRSGSRRFSVCISSNLIN